MSVAEKAELARAAGRIATIWMGEQVVPQRPTPSGKAPPSTATLTCDWLTDALCKDVPGARVTDFQLGQGTDGTCSRQPLTVAYNSTGTAAALTTALYTKSSPSLVSRLLCGINDLMVYEGQFYLAIRPELDIETPTAFHCAYDSRSGRSMLLLEDIVASRGATFTDPTTSVITRTNADEMVDLMATYHGTFWGSPRLDTDFVWLTRASDWQRKLNNNLGFGRMVRNGIERSRDFLPADLVAREKDIWPALLKSIDLEATRPQTLVHQDPHSLNWYWTGDGRMGIYDWQVNGKGSWALDVAYALGCGLSTEDRRAWERDLLAQYAERLAAFTAEPPSADAAWLSYRQQLMHGLSYWFASFGRMKLQPEMNTREVSEINITRLAQAAVDLDTVDAILSA
jgi:hypothetical protein